MASGFETRRKNDLVGLQLIHDFGWLRSAELGPLMRDLDGKYLRTQADRMIRGWQERDLVIVRKLPDGAGRAVVLSEAGARLLRDEGVKDARSGKDLGTTNGDEWRPDKKWKHDLIATGVLVQLKRKGYTILPETRLRRENPALTKIPDGLAWKNNDVFWIEVEHARKEGEPKRHLANTLIAIAYGRGEKVSDHQPTMALVAFVGEANDERRNRLNHQLRITNALEARSLIDFNQNWARCTLLGNGVSSIDIVETRIESNQVDDVLSALEFYGWKENEDEVLEAQYQGVFKAAVWYPEDHGCWYYQVTGPGVSMSAKDAANIPEAKRGCANVISAHSRGHVR